jgi:hypothetical protein
VDSASSVSKHTVPYLGGVFLLFLPHLFFALDLEPNCSLSHTSYLSSRGECRHVNVLILLLWGPLFAFPLLTRVAVVHYIIVHMKKTPDMHSDQCSIIPARLVRPITFFTGKWPASQANVLTCSDVRFSRCQIRQGKRPCSQGMSCMFSPGT